VKNLKKIKIAAVLLMIHGIIEVAGLVALFPIANGTSYVTFKMTYLQDNLIFVSVLGVIFGISKIISAIAIWRNRMYGLILGSMNCFLVLLLCMFFLPVGIVDALLALPALILLISGYLGKRLILEK